MTTEPPLRKPKVIVPNLPMRHDSALNQKVPALDLNPASRYGVITPLTEGRIDTEALVSTIERIKIAFPSIVHPEDYIVCVGDVIITSAVIAECWRINGVARVLRWDRVKREYQVAELPA